MEEVTHEHRVRSDGAFDCLLGLTALVNTSNLKPPPTATFERATEAWI